jgi:hypothetical protein
MRISLVVRARLPGRTLILSSHWHTVYASRSRSSRYPHFVTQLSLAGVPAMTGQMGEEGVY